MPKLLDTRLIGQDIADVSSRDYAPAVPGQVLQVASDGVSMVLDAGANFSYLSRDAEGERSGISLQQFLCSTWHSITPALTPAYASIYGMTYAFGIFWIAGVDVDGRAKISSSYVDAITGSGSVETGWSDSFQLNGANQVNVGSGSPSPFSGAVFGVIYENGIILAYGANGRIAVLGSSGWEACTMPVGSEAYSIYRIAYGHRKGWVAVGTETSNSFGPGITLTSEDGFTWKTLSTPALGVGVPIYGIAYGGSFYGQNFFIAVGGAVTTAPNTTNHIAYSMDGVNWTQMRTAHPFSAHYSVTFGNGQWMVGTQFNATTNTSLLCSTVGQGSDTILTWSPVTGVSAGNIQTISYGNGMFVAASTFVYGSISGSDSRLIYTPSPAWTNSAGASCYGNGVFLVGSRDGKLVRSSVINEIGLGPQGTQGAQGIQGAQGAQGPAGPQGPGASAQTVVTQNTSANNTITNSNQSWVFNQDTNEIDPRSTIIFDIAENTSNTVERIMVNVRPLPSPVGLYISFSTGSRGGGFRGIIPLTTYVGGTSSFIIPTSYAACLLEFYRFPSTSDWYFNVVYLDVGPTPPGDGGGTGG